MKFNGSVSKNLPCCDLPCESQSEWRVLLCKCDFLWEMLNFWQLLRNLCYRLLWSNMTYPKGSNFFLGHILHLDHDLWLILTRNQLQIRQIITLQSKNYNKIFCPWTPRFILSRITSPQGNSVIAEQILPADILVWAQEKICLKLCQNTDGNVQLNRKWTREEFLSVPLSLSPSRCCRSIVLKQ